MEQITIKLTQKCKETFERLAAKKKQAPNKTGGKNSCPSMCPRRFHPRFQQENEKSDRHEGHYIHFPGNLVATEVVVDQSTEKGPQSAPDGDEKYKHTIRGTEDVATEPVGEENRHHRRRGAIAETKHDGVDEQYCGGAGIHEHKDTHCHE